MRKLRFREVKHIAQVLPPVQYLHRDLENLTDTQMLVEGAAALQHQKENGSVSA